jgi:hypothetical protein
MVKKDWRSPDYRIESLHLIVSGLENSLQVLKKKLDEISWYDGLWLLEESEPICGLAFIAVQNYINSSIYDRFENLDKQHKLYKIGNKIKGTNRTHIELIVAIANYFKHRDHPEDLRKDTANILNDFNFQFDKKIDITDSPIFKGLDLFSENWDLIDVVKVAEIWREKLWEIED